jgi:hypothetical protein
MMAVFLHDYTPYLFNYLYPDLCGRPRAIARALNQLVPPKRLYAANPKSPCTPVVQVVETAQNNKI